MPVEDFLNETRSISENVKGDPVTVVLTGGEPLLRKDLEYCVMELRKQGFRCGIVSNGMNYSAQRHDSLIKAGMGALTLSLDGMEESHNWLRNSPQSFKKVCDALDILKEDKRLNYDVVTCVNQKNFNELEKIRDFLIEKKVKAWRLFTIAPIGRAVHNDRLTIHPAQLKQLMEFIHDERIRGRIDAKFSCEAYVGPYENEVREGFFFCRAGINIGSILIDGSISACPNIDRAFVQGNIYKDNFMDVWNNRFQVMRDRSWTKTGICKDCKDYNYCLGNGLHWWNADKKGVLRCHSKMVCH